MGRKIYVAGSWKNSHNCINIAQILRNNGNEVDCFCEPKESSGKDRFTFNYLDIPDWLDHDGISALDLEPFKKAFAEDKKWLDWADTVVLVLPSGKSAHLEAGYGVGQGKDLFIIGEFPKAEVDVMYGFANGLFKYEKIYELVLKLNQPDFRFNKPTYDDDSWDPYVWLE